ncbi:pectin lyase fold/virulence factor [Ilyonectria robusta]|uniref:pectin lyase fold/virulence factor n=1 Tax=Ilyonectria robusta TaxID=1079257 RepID=UPI001E8E4E0F|nr:pectin lyase fold/virulence factor [Ilyonectria robusta]KAH8662688.1 pectin lyase fold/virulence factor [Ilyonectria robusta]
MKFTSTLAGLFLVGSVAASPLSDEERLEGLYSARNKPKCQYKDKLCCNYKDYYTPDYGNGEHYGHRHTIYVRAHESIQRAINKASRGDKIVVTAGIYAEQLTISKDGIELIGKGAVLVPAKKAVKNMCSGLSGPQTEAGICVQGKGIKLDKFVIEHRKVLSVERPVEDVSITGFEVRKFSGINIAILGAKNTRISKNTLTDGAKYGTLTAGSTKTLVEGNKVSHTGLGVQGIAICMDNFSDVQIKNNEVTDYGVGLCVQTNGADVHHNKVSQSCFGIFVDPGVTGAKIRHNHVGPSNPACQIAWGITIDGAVGSKVSDNLVEGQKNKGTAVGLVVIDEECLPTSPLFGLTCLTLKRKSVPSDNIFLRNTFRDNDLDVFFNTTSKNNNFKCNSCKTSLPKGLCAK